MDRSNSPNSQNEVIDGASADACEKDDLDTDYLVRLLESHGEALMLKSRLPNTMQQKNKATATIIQQILEEKGLHYTAQKLTRKIANLRSRVKKKADVNRTGNKKVQLSEAEKRLWTLMSGEENPSLCKVSCKFICIVYLCRSTFSCN